MEPSGSGLRPPSPPPQPLLPPPLLRKRHRTVSVDLLEATESILHVSLLPNFRQLSPNGKGKNDSPDLTWSPTPSGSAGGAVRVRKRKSVEDLRFPPLYPGGIGPKVDDQTLLDSRDGIGNGGNGFRRNPRGSPIVYAVRQTEGDSGENTRGLSNGHSSDQTLPVGFLSSPGLLRRCSSFQGDLMAFRDGEEDVGEDGNEDEFTSDEESFHARPPSIASSMNSQRSSKIGIQIEDQSDRECVTFATDVKVKGFCPVGEKDLGGFVVFDIEIKTREGTLIHILKRYSAFVRLRLELVQSFPELRAWIPRLPPKTSFAKYRPSFLERRRQQLGYWLSTIMLHPQVGGCVVIRKWILE